MSQDKPADDDDDAEQGPPSRAWQVAKIGIVIIAVGAMLYGLTKLLSTYRWSDIVDGARAVSPISIAIALLLLIGQYASMAFRERLGLVYAGHPEFSSVRSTIAALIVRSLSMLGLASITGFGLRVRLYDSWGLSGKDLARITAYDQLTYYVGQVITIGVIFTWVDMPFPVDVGIALPTTRVIGIIALVVAGLYAARCIRRGGSLTIRKIRFRLPSKLPLFGQLLLPTSETLLGVGIIWLCLPPDLGLGFAQLALIVVAASIVGAISQVPSGLGVFEAVVLSFTPSAASSAVMAGLLVRRVISNLVPIGVGAVLLTVVELRHRGREERPAWLADVVASTMALFTFSIGVLMLLLAAAPGEALSRVSDGFAFTIGSMLLVVAHGLYLRRRRAWFLAFALFTLRAVVALFAGPDQAPLIMALVATLLLWLSRGVFIDGGVAMDHDIGRTAGVSLTLLAIGFVVMFADNSSFSDVTAVRIAGLVVVATIIWVALASRWYRRRRSPQS